MSAYDKLKGMSQGKGFYGKDTPEKRAQAQAGVDQLDAARAETRRMAEKQRSDLEASVAAMRKRIAAPTPPKDMKEGNPENKAKRNNVDADIGKKKHGSGPMAKWAEGPSAVPSLRRTGRQIRGKPLAARGHVRVGSGFHDEPVKVRPLPESQTDMKKLRDMIPTRKKDENIEEGNPENKAKKNAMSDKATNAHFRGDIPTNHGNVRTVGRAVGKMKRNGLFGDRLGGSKKPNLPEGNTEDKWDDMYGDEDHGRPSRGGKLGSKGQLMGMKGKPVGSRTDQARSELPRLNRTQNVVRKDELSLDAYKTYADKVKDKVATHPKRAAGVQKASHLAVKKILHPASERGPLVTKNESVDNTAQHTSGNIDMNEASADSQAKEWLKAFLKTQKKKFPGQSAEERKKYAMTAFHAKHGMEETNTEINEAAPRTSRIVAKAGATSKVSKAPKAPKAAPSFSPSTTVTHSKSVAPTADSGAPETKANVTTVSKTVAPASKAPTAPTPIVGPHTAPSSKPTNPDSKALYKTAKKAATRKALSTHAAGEKQSVVPVGSYAAKTIARDVKKQLGNDKPDAWSTDTRLGESFNESGELSTEEKIKEFLKRYIQAAIEKHLENVEPVDEISTTSGAGAYLTPGAFTGTKGFSPKKKKDMEVFDYRLSPLGKKFANQKGDKLGEAAELYVETLNLLVEEVERRQNSYDKPHQKLGLAIAEVSKQIKKIAEAVSQQRKMKVENNVGGGKLWKRTFEHLVKLESRLMNIARDIREIRN